MYINEQTKFIDCTDAESETTCIAFYVDEAFRAYVVTNKWGGGYDLFRKARAFLKSRRYGLAGGKSANNTLYIINQDNEMFQQGLHNIVRRFRNE